MKCEAVFANSSGHSVRKMCKVLGLKETTYYRWKKAEKRRNQRIREERKDILAVRKVFEENHRIYGYRRIRETLRESGKQLSEWKVRRIMRENGLYPEQIKKFKPGKSGKADGKYYENIVHQQFRPERPNEVWVGDITYLRTYVGWVYLAIVIDLYNREVIGYEVSKRIDADLACNALGNAIAKNGKPKSLIFHSDRGCQYSSKKYQQMLESNEITGSMSKPGYPYDNSCAESFFASMKKEYILRKEYGDISSLRRDIFYYIEMFYNRKRLHSTLGYMSPVSYRLQHCQVQTA